MIEHCGQRFLNSSAIMRQTRSSRFPTCSLSTHGIVFVHGVHHWLSTRLFRFRFRYTTRNFTQVDVLDFTPRMHKPSASCVPRFRQSKKNKKNMNDKKRALTTSFSGLARTSTSRPLHRQYTPVRPTAALERLKSIISHNERHQLCQPRTPREQAEKSCRQAPANHERGDLGFGCHFSGRIRPRITRDMPSIARHGLG